MTQKQLTDTLDAITKRAPALRAAGVLTVSVGEVAFTLATPEHAVSEPPEAARAEPADPFMDPATFGRRDGLVPGYGAPDGHDEG